MFVRIVFGKAPLECLLYLLHASIEGFFAKGAEAAPGLTLEPCVQARYFCWGKTTAYFDVSDFTPLQRNNRPRQISHISRQTA
jgi:hypothetical protein